MQLEHGENVWLLGNRLLDVAGIFVEDVLAAGDDLRQDREPIASRRLGKDWAIPTLFALSLLKPPFGIAIAAGLVQSCFEAVDMFVSLSGEVLFNLHL